MEKQSLKTHVCARSWLITLEVIVLKLNFPEGNTRSWFYFTMERLFLMCGWLSYVCRASAQTF
jgi:hypothetical protein